MTDILLQEKQLWLHNTFMDWVQSPQGLSEEEELATAIRVAIGTDARANVEEVLPDPDEEDRRGWWGDYQAEEIWGGWPIGCKNWLLRRAKISDAYSWEGDTVVRAKGYCRTALQPFIDKRICSRVDVTAARVGREEIDVHIIMYRGPKVLIELRWQALWTEITGF